MVPAPEEPHLIEVQTAPDLDATRELMSAYRSSLGVDLCFQNFDRELRDLPGEYSPPDGALYLAMVNAVAAGCCALRPLADVDYANACEMKRLYVLPAYRGLGIGRLLVERVMSTARAMGYAHMLLDTLDEMETARALYREVGFEEVPAYYYNPLPGTRYLLARLQGH